MVLFVDEAAKQSVVAAGQGLMGQVYGLPGGGKEAAQVATSPALVVYIIEMRIQRVPAN
ncbi:hypothetical protein BGZ52_000242, partial [Haplosporangium bisporale]